MPALDNARWEIFAQQIVAGKKIYEAYQEAFPKSKEWKMSALKPQASRLLHTQEVADRIKELKDIAAGDAVMSREDRMRMLTEIARDPTHQMRSRLNAIDTLNKMTGEYVKKTEVTVNNPISDTVARIAEMIDCE